MLRGGTKSRKHNFVASIAVALFYGAVGVRVRVKLPKQIIKNLL